MSKRILIFGSSIANGSCDNEMGGWVNRLSLYLKNESDKDYGVYNLGISGNTSEDLKKRVDNESKARNPDIIIIGIGSNDSAQLEENGKHWVEPKNYKKNLKEIHNKIKKICDKVIFIEMNNVNEKFTAPVPFGIKCYYTNKAIKKYLCILKDFCKENKLYLIPLFGELDYEDLEDGLHPNSKGHEKMFQRVKDFLMENKII